MLPRVSLHICTRDRPKELYGLLVSLYCQTFQNWDLIIVDESDISIAAEKCVRDIITRIKCEQHGIKMIRHEGSQRQGICHARNAAIKADNWNDIFIRIDDDTVCTPDYLEKLISTYVKLKEKGIKVGAVGGTVPLLGQPEILRNVKYVMPIFNKISYKNENFEMEDDGGISYDSEEIIESDHLRSSFLFTREATDAVEGYSEELGGVTGFREETDYAMKLKMFGFKCFTIPTARAWHLQSLTGGTRYMNNQNEYAQSVFINNNFFQRKWKRLLKRGKLPVGSYEGI